MLIASLRSGKMYLKRTKLFAFSIANHRNKIFGGICWLLFLTYYQEEAFSELCSYARSSPS